MKRLIFLTFIICHLSFVITTQASAKEYDGIWFLGFNLDKPPFDNIKVRQAVAHTIDTAYIALKIADSQSVPTSLVPPGVLGFDPALKPFKQNISYAKKLMAKAGYQPTNAALKNITLLHTNGVKTIEIAKKLQKDLKQLGMKVTLVEVNYWDDEKWKFALASGENNLFLMGYKAEVERLFSPEAVTPPSPRETDAAKILEPLFRSNGGANFTNYANPTVDMLFDQISVIDPTLKKERDVRYKELNKLLYKELPAIVLFYIEKL